MIDLRRVGPSGTLLVSIAVIVAACSSGSASPSAAASSDTSASPSSEASAAASSGTAAASPQALLGAIPTFDLKALGGAIPGVDSYRTSTSVGGVETNESIVVTQPVLSKAIKIFDGGKVSNRYVLIGDEAWSADGADGKFTSIPTAQASQFLMFLDPAVMLGAYAAVDWSHVAGDQGSEQKNGVQARHLRLDSTSLLGVAGAMPAGSAIDVWVSDAGYLVSWEMSGFPGDANFAIEITGVNDPANKVERPS